jgi:hypothetical protein
MRSSWKCLVAASAGLLAAPQLAMADDVETQLRQMQERMTELEQKLDATNDELENSKERVEQQQDLIKKAGLDEGRGAGSGLADFLNMVQIDGFAAASYNYNFNLLKDTDVTQPDIPGAFPPSTVGGENGGVLGITAIGHTNSNSFQLDQLWFGIGKPATMESNAGFRADIVYGALADANREGTFFSNDTDDIGQDDHGTGDLPHLFQAYAEYLVPVGANGISLKGGRFATPIGAESFRQDSNFNITRGINWALQPVNHTGLQASGHCDACGLDWNLGVVNSYSDTMSDRDNEKGVVGGVKYAGETFAVAANAFYGGDSADHPAWAFVSFLDDTGIARSGDKIGVADVVVTWNPTERFSSWINYDYYWFHNNNTDLSGTDIHTISFASRFAVTDRAGISWRGEYQAWDGVNVGGSWPAMGVWAITGTVDYALTENLIVKAEARYDAATIKNVSDETFFVDGNGDLPRVFDDNDQVLGIIQMLYKF